MAENANMFADKFQFQTPQVNLARPTAVRMWIVALCAFLVVLQSSLGDSFASLIVALSAVAAAVLTEFICLHRGGRTRALRDGSAVASALTLAILLPNQISPLYAAAGAVFAIAVAKHSFGGLGSNWINPAAAGWLLIRFSWPDSFMGAIEASPLIQFLGNGASAYGGYATLLTSPFPGIIADRGGLALLIGVVVITAVRANRFWVPLVFLAVFSVLTRYAAALPIGGSPWSGDVGFALLSGGTLAAAFLLANDPVTGAKSNGGILLATVLMGLLAFFFRFYAAEPYGAFYAVVLVNAIVPLIRAFERRRLYERFS